MPTGAEPPEGKRFAHRGFANTELLGKEFLSETSVLIKLVAKDVCLDAFVGKRGQILGCFDSWNTLHSGSAYSIQRP
jgi:hypothetical protein